MLDSIDMVVKRHPPTITTSDIARKIISEKTFGWVVFPCPVNKVNNRFKVKARHFLTLKGEDGRQLIQKEIVEKAANVVNKLSHLFPSASDKEVFFEPDDDGTILMFIEFDRINIMINFYPSKIQFSVEDEEDFKSLYFEIPYNTSDLLVKEVEKWINKKKTVSKPQSWMNLAWQDLLKQTTLTSLTTDQNVFSLEHLEEVKTKDVKKFQ